MEERLRAVLRDLGYTDDEIHLELAGTEQVSGYIVSDAFRGESQMGRQDQLWDRLRERLEPHELGRIVAILTMTPAEIGS